MLRDLSERELGSPSSLRDYRLDEGLEAMSGQILLTGTQALVRLPLMQRQRDRVAGLNTAGFISGYRGSPLGAYDQALWRAHESLSANDVRFLPAVNEELAATAILGSQQVETDPLRTVDGVFSIWYGKGPGLDRAGDALRHGNALGSSPHGGVLVVVGDDHGCVSSSMPHQSDFSMRAWNMPVLNPANVAELIEYGLYGWALSRHSGAWVGLKAISETVESATTVDLARVRTHFPAPVLSPWSDGTHYRPNDLPGFGLEERLAAKLEAVRAFARMTHVDKLICPSRDGDIGIVTCGKAHLDLLEALDRLGLGLADIEAAGVRLYKIGLSFPVEGTRVAAFAQGLKEILVVEEKGSFVEQQIKDILYNRTAAGRPAIIGKQDTQGRPLLPAIGELRPSRVMPVLADWFARNKPALDRGDCRNERLAAAMPPKPLPNGADGVKRVPYFCPGCPHNISTKVPAGSQAMAGIGCHFMASWMGRGTGNLVAMGGEGAHWVSRSMFTRTRHVFQNLGDGTYFHSGSLAIRQAVAANVNITFKILYNGAVAMTGGQPVDGTLRVIDIARQVASEGVRRVVVVSDKPEKYRREKHLFPVVTSVHHRDELNAVQIELRDTPGVTVLIYAQPCASEKRRRRKIGHAAGLPKRLFINTAICEDCGECSRQSNCLALVATDTPFGRKRRIAQSSCNMDHACDSGSCPSFVSVIGGEPRQPPVLDARSLQRLLLNLPEPTWPRQRQPYNILIAGVGGTGVATLGAILTMAAHLERRSASALDFKGFAQKGGAILSFVRFGMSDQFIHQVRIDTGQADALLACDLVVGASPEALRTLRSGHSQVVANAYQIPTASMVLDPDSNPHRLELMAKIGHAAGHDRCASFDAGCLADEFLGNSIFANMVVLGYAWQKGLIPVTMEALGKAIELNGVAIAMNRLALDLGRLTAADPATVGLQDECSSVPGAEEAETVRAIVERHMRHLTAYHDAACARRYQALVAEVEVAERRHRRANEPLRLTNAVALNYPRLLAYKDEYEVARLHTDGLFGDQLKRQFQGDYKIGISLSVPFLRSIGVKDRLTFGAWCMPILKIMAKAKVLRGTRFDLFGRTALRSAERGLASDYEQVIKALLPELAFHNLPLAEELAALPSRIRGFGNVKLRNIRIAKKAEAELLKEFDLKPIVCQPVQAALESRQS